MSWDNRVLWSEGLFLQPHHFQQHDRYLERLTRGQAGIGCALSLGPHAARHRPGPAGPGQAGRHGLRRRAAGRHPVRCPGERPSAPAPGPGDDSTRTPQATRRADPLPGPAAAPPGGGGERRTRGPGDHAALSGRGGHGTRQHPGPGTETLMEVGRLDLRLLRERDARDGFACCGLARVLECRADRQVVLDAGYIPPCLDYARPPDGSPASSRRSRVCCTARPSRAPDGCAGWAAAGSRTGRTSCCCN